jgi:hypothetical protein
VTVEQFRRIASQPFDAQAELSIAAGAIARELCHCAWILTGKTGNRAALDRLPLDLQSRYRYLAERSIATIDPTVRLEAQEDAIRDTVAWVRDEPSDGSLSAAEIARQAIGHYELHLIAAGQAATRGY